jgi:hypothetical protein
MKNPKNTEAAGGNFWVYCHEGDRSVAGRHSTVEDLVDAVLRNLGIPNVDWQLCHFGSHYVEFAPLDISRLPFRGMVFASDQFTDEVQSEVRVSRALAFERKAESDGEDMRIRLVLSLLGSQIVEPGVATSLLPSTGTAVDGDTPWRPDRGARDLFVAEITGALTTVPGKSESSVKGSVRLHGRQPIAMGLSSENGGGQPSYSEQLRQLPDSMRAIRLAELELPVRIRNRLDEIGNPTVGEVVDSGFQMLLRRRGIGVSSLVRLAESILLSASERPVLEPRCFGRQDCSVNGQNVPDRDSSVGEDPSVMELSLSDIGLPPRIANRRQMIAGMTVKDLLEAGIQSLMDIPGIGSRSLEVVRRRLLELGVRFPEADDSSPQQYESVSIGASRTLVDAVSEAIIKLGPRDQEILKARLGYEGAIVTLDEEASVVGISRERIRQLEKRAVRSLESLYSVYNINRRLSVLRETVPGPLFVVIIGSHDHFFRGVESRPVFYGSLISALSGGEWHLAEYADQPYLATYSKADLTQAVRDARESLAEATLAWRPLSEIRTLVDAHLSAIGGGDVLEYVFREITQSAVLARCSEPIFVAPTRTRATLICGALAESPVPLHYSRILTMIRERYGERITSRSVQAECHRCVDTLLFGRGVYGLRQHVPFNESEQGEIRARLEDIIASEPERQWHATELVDRVEFESSRVDELDQYLVDIVLKASPVVRSLGRMTYALADNSREGKSRIYVTDAVVRLLVQKKRPMSMKEIVATLSEFRGVHRNFMMLQDERLLRMGKGILGLYDRDLPLTNEDVREFLRVIERRLSDRREGLHKSELRQVVEASGAKLPREFSDEMAMELLRRDRRFLCGHGALVGLSTWGSVRRMNKNQAIRSVLANGAALTVDEVKKRASLAARRDFTSVSIDGSLQAIGAVYDQDSKTWSLPEERPV